MDLSSDELIGGYDEVKGKKLELMVILKNSHYLEKKLMI